MQDSKSFKTTKYNAFPKVGWSDISFQELYVQNVKQHCVPAVAESPRRIVLSALHLLLLAPKPKKRKGETEKN